MKPIAAILGLLVLLVDRLFKFWIEQKPFVQTNGLFGIERFHNTGIAFSIPFPLWIHILFSLCILTWLGKILFKDCVITTWYIKIGKWLFLFGALSNLFDRIYYGYTIDYLRIANGVVNIADGMILLGLILAIHGSMPYTTREICSKKYNP